MLIIGLDVCKLSVVACPLQQRPPEPRQFIFDAQFETFQANAAGIKGLLNLLKRYGSTPEETIAVMEPTGVNYSKLWGTHLVRAGIKVYLVGHEKLRTYRRDTLQLPDKDDEADALALACYCFDYQDSEQRFVQQRTPTIARIRQLVLRLAHLNRVQNPIINRMRQDLCWQFPEIAGVKTKRRLGKNIPLSWRWLAGETKSKRYDGMYEKSIGLGLTETVKSHAQRLCELQREEMQIESQLIELTKGDEFKKYRKVFALFGFGLRVQSIILSQIYPFEGFLKDGKPEVIIRKGRKSGKGTKRYLSERRFVKSLGVAPTQDSSGDKKKEQMIGGSDICRIALWQWIYTRIEVIKNRPKNNIGESIGKKLDQEKTAKRPIRLVRARVSSQAAKLLFKELVKEFREDS